MTILGVSYKLKEFQIQLKEYNICFVDRTVVRYK